MFKPLESSFTHPSLYLVIYSFINVQKAIKKQTTRHLGASSNIPYLPYLLSQPKNTISLVSLYSVSLLQPPPLFPSNIHKSQPSTNPKKMQILLLGATGRTGHLVLSDALGRGHTITALVRDPSALDAFLSTLPADQRARLHLTTGSALHPLDVAAALATIPVTTRDDNSRLVVISTLNARRTSDNPFAAPHPTDSPPRMMADSVANVLSALREQQPQAQTTTTTIRPKMVILSALGAGSSTPNTHPVIRALIAFTNMRLQYADHAAVEDELRKDNVADFVLARPTRLVEGAGEEKDADEVARVFDVGTGSAGHKSGRVVPMMATVSRRAVARFLVDAAESQQWDGMAPILVG